MGPRPFSTSTIEASGLRSRSKTDWLEDQLTLAAPSPESQSSIKDVATLRQFSVFRMSRLVGAHGYLSLNVRPSRDRECDRSLLGYPREAREHKSLQVQMIELSRVVVVEYKALN